MLVKKLLALTLCFVTKADNIVKHNVSPSCYPPSATAGMWSWNDSTDTWFALSGSSSYKAENSYCTELDPSATVAKIYNQDENDTIQELLVSTPLNQAYIGASCVPSVFGSDYGDGYEIQWINYGDAYGHYYVPSVYLMTYINFEDDIGGSCNYPPYQELNMRMQAGGDWGFMTCSDTMCSVPTVCELRC